MMARMVSVVIPAYNAVRYVKEAIDSVLAQTYRNFEIIVVDDGSTDETPRILQQFGEAIRYIRQPNQGLSSARNTAIRNSCAEFIAPLDADDLWEPKYLEVMIDFFEQNSQMGGVYCGFQYTNAVGEIVGRPTTKVVPPEQFREIVMDRGNWLVPSAVIFRKSLAEDVQLFDESIGPVADTDLWIRMSNLAAFAGLPDVLVKYRCHGGNMSKNPSLMINASHLLTERMFGPPEGDPSQWSKEKQRSYRRLFWAGTQRYLASGDVDSSAAYFLRLFDLSRTTVLDIAFWRSIARLHIPLEYQNDPSRLPDWAQAQADIFSLLDKVSTFTTVSPSLPKFYHRIKSSAFLGLADEAGWNLELRRSYAWLWKTAQSNPQIIFSRPYWGTILRHLQRKLVQWSRF